MIQPLCTINLRAFSLCILALAPITGCQSQSSKAEPSSSTVSVAESRSGVQDSDKVIAAIESTKDAVEPNKDHETHIAPKYYTVDHYDVTRDPQSDLNAAVEQAARENKRVFVQVGGDWCGWCKLMSNFMESNSKVRSILEKNFLVMKVTYTQEQTNEAFLSKYPKISGYPHVFIVDQEGKLLHSQDTAKLEEGKGYNEQAFIEFLEAWSPVSSL